MWFWRPKAGATFREMTRGNGDNKAWSPGRSRISRKTIAQGRPGVPARTCGSAACFFAARGPWVRRAPGLPCALYLPNEGGLIGKARTHRAARTRSVLPFFARPILRDARNALLRMRSSRACTLLDPHGEEARKRRLNHEPHSLAVMPRESGASGTPASDSSTAASANTGSPASGRRQWRERRSLERRLNSARGAP